MTEQRVICIPAAAPEPGSIYDCIPLVPETYLLFAGPAACARHGLRAGEAYHREGRIGYLLTTAEENADGSYLSKIEAAAEEIRFERKPAAIVILLCCSDVILSTDTGALRKSLEKKLGIPVRFLTVNRLNMYCKGDKQLMFPPQLEVICSLLERTKKKQRCVNLIGTLLAPVKDGALFRSLERAGIRAETLTGHGSFESFRSMAGASCNLALTEEAADCCRKMEKELGIRWMPFYSGFHIHTMAEQYEKLSEFLGIAVDYQEESERAEELASRIAEKLRPYEVILNGGMMQTPWSLARELAERSVRIRAIYYTRFSGKEKKHREYLESRHDGIRIIKADSDLQMLPPMPERKKQACSAQGFSRMIGDLEYLEGLL